MPSSHDSVCEQCGAPLRKVSDQEGCLNCLLQNGIENRPGPAGSARRTYQHYEILQRADGSPWELGRSEMGVTFKARDVNLGTTVALRVLAADFSDRPEALQEVRRAVQAAAQVHHPNVAEVFHFGMLENPALPGTAGKFPGRECFYTMEYVEGESLEQRVRRQSPFRAVPALEIALQVAQALIEANKRGLTNRAVKPAMIKLAGPATSVKVINLGLDFAAGFPAPAAPDDLYSLGMILCFALCGETPAADGTLPGALFRVRRVPPAVTALLALLVESDGSPRPSLPTAIGLIESCRESLAQRTTLRRRRWSLTAVLAVIAVLIGFAFYFKPHPSPGEKSIAVLPFRNLSQNPRDAFFAEGLRDDIVSRLVKIRDLRVIGHPPAAADSAGQTPDYNSISREIGAQYLLTGNLRSAGDRILLEVSLLDASRRRQIWSEKYDRKLQDAINLQGELAGNVAAALDIRLSAQERTKVGASSTLNPDAYVLYLRGRNLENSVATQISNYEAAAALYRQAIALDPGFALAHARLSIVLGLLYRFRAPSDELRIQAATEVSEGLRLQPDLGEAHLAKGANLYRVERDFEGALGELQIAQRLLPNDPAPRAFIALIRRRQGKWREAWTGLEEAHRLDPRVRRYLEELHATACLLRDWPTAAREADLALALSPEVAQLKAQRALVDFWQAGNLEPLTRLIAPASKLPDVKEDLIWLRWDVALLTRDFAMAEATLDHYPRETLPSVLGAPIPKSYLRGCIWLARGDRARARETLEMARPSIEAETIARPGDALRHARLGLLYAYMGRKTEAMREGERAVEITPVFEDAVDGHQWACNLALIHAWVGDTAEAMAMVESLLRQPGCVSPLE